MALSRYDHHFDDDDDDDDDVMMMMIGNTKRGKADPSSRRAQYGTVQVHVHVDNGDHGDDDHDH